MSDKKRPPSGTKVVWGYGILLKHLRWYITTSRFIQTADKESLISSLEKVNQELTDAESRARGRIPMTPKKEKEWDAGIDKRRDVSDA